MSESARYAGYDWIAVKKQKPVSVEGVSYVPEKHHIEETNFLIETVRKLATRLDVLQQTDKSTSQQTETSENSATTDASQSTTDKNSDNNVKNADEAKQGGDTLIYKIFLKSEFDNFIQAGRTFGSPLDVKDHFIHFSTKAQSAETARRYFTGIPDLMLVAVNIQECGGALKWEFNSVRNEDFPHLYRELFVRDMVWARPFDSVNLAAA